MFKDNKIDNTYCSSDACAYRTNGEIDTLNNMEIIKKMTSELLLSIFKKKSERKRKANKKKIAKLIGVLSKSLSMKNKLEKGTDEAKLR